MNAAPDRQSGHQQHSKNGTSVAAEAYVPEIYSVPPWDDEFRFGVLRHEFSGRVNCATRYVFKKAHPVPVEYTHEAEVWQPTARRIDVLLPQGAPDRFLSPATLIKDFIANVGGQLDLLITMKMAINPDRPLHEGFERCRAFARDVMANDHGLATIVILHDPVMLRTRRPRLPHLHVLAPASRLVCGDWRDPSPMGTDDGATEFRKHWMG